MSIAFLVPNYFSFLPLNVAQTGICKHLASAAFHSLRRALRELIQR